MALMVHNMPPQDACTNKSTQSIPKLYQNKEVKRVLQELRAIGDPEAMNGEHRAPGLSLCIAE